MSQTSDQIYDSLPSQYRQGDEVIKVLLEAGLEKADEARAALANVQDYYDPTQIDDQWLDWAIHLNGWPVLIGFTAAIKRAALAKIPNWRKNFGQVGMLEDVITTYFANAWTVTITPRYSIEGGFRIAKGRIAKGRIWDEKFPTEVIISVNEIRASVAVDKLKGLLERVLPPWMLYTLKFLPPPAPVYQAKNEYSGSGTTLVPVSVSVPSGAQAGDLLVVAALVGGGAGVINPPAGWAKYTESVISNQKLCYFARVMQSGDTSWSFPLTGSLWYAVVIANYRTGNTFAPGNIGLGNHTGTQAIPQPCLHIVSFMSASSTPTASGFTQRAKFDHPGGTYISLWDRAGTPPSGALGFGNSDAWQNALLINQDI
jgi:hypothetical protein